LDIGTACVAVMAFHIGFTMHAGVWGEFIDSYKMRHSAPSPAYVIDRHTQWMDILYGAAPLVVGALWYVVFLARAIAGRARTRDLAVLTFLYVNTLYIYLFAEGSSVHLYRVFFYSGFFALASVDLLADLSHAARRLGGRVLACGLFALCCFLYFYAELPHAWHNLIESRVLMGTHGETHYDPHDDEWKFVEDVTRMTAPTDRVILHYPSMGARKEMWFYLDRSLDEVTSMTQVAKHVSDHSVLIYDDRAITPTERTIAEALMKGHPTRFYDRFVYIDLRRHVPRVEGWTFVRGRITPGYRFFVSHVYGPLTLVRQASMNEVCTAIRLNLPLAKDEPPPRAERLQQPCYDEYQRRRAATTGDTIMPPALPAPAPALPAPAR
jgi:hypothetical protein